MTEVIVPDASVILKWIPSRPNEINREQALKLRQLAMQETIILKVPTLWIYEVGNIITLKMPKHAKELMEVLVAFNMEEVPWNIEWLHKCLHLVQHYKVSFYDAAYHSLALTQKGTFVTADMHYFKEAHAAGSIESLDSWDHKGVIL